VRTFSSLVEAARIDGPLDPVDADLPEDYQPAGKMAPSGRTTRAQDPKLRDAVERRALDVAKEYYEKLDGRDYTEVGKPYDIHVTVRASPGAAKSKAARWRSTQWS
jgi:hypothetical protein